MHADEHAVSDALATLTLFKATVDRCKHAAEHRIAGVNRTWVVIVANDLSIDAAVHRVAGINRARIIIVTDDRFEYALAGIVIADID
ncbi:MAG TPA: hypothetical protein VHV31_17080, partial [Nitrolancea sp.]|nr:hypothetical protein [Nitrolancea sp.]